MEELHGNPTVGSRPKVWTRGQKWMKLCQRWRAGKCDNLGGGESDPAVWQSRRRWVRSCRGCL